AVSDDHVQDQIFGENETRILAKEIAQSDERLDGKVPILRGIDFGQQMFDVAGEVCLAWSHLSQKRSALHAIAPLELVADHQSGAVLEGFPDARIKPSRYLPEGASPAAVIEPPIGRGGRRLRGLASCRMPRDLNAGSQVKRFLALEPPGNLRVIPENRNQT